MPDSVFSSRKPLNVNFGGPDYVCPDCHVGQFPAEALESRGRLGEAGDEDRKTNSIRDDASFAQGYLGLGIAYNAAGQHAEAIKPLEKCVKMDAPNPATTSLPSPTPAPAKSKHQPSSLFCFARQPLAKPRIAWPLRGRPDAAASNR